MQLLKGIKLGQYRFRLFNLYASSKVKNENDAIRNRIYDFDKWCINFSTKNQLAVKNRRLLIAAEFHFVHPVEKDS